MLLPTDQRRSRLKKAARLNPFRSCYSTLGSAYREAGQYEEALIEFKRCIKNNPNSITTHQILAGIYAATDRYEEAREAWSEVLKLDPKMTVEKAFPKRWPYGQEHRERGIAALHKAGIK